jgi:hypothetical protein
MDKLHTVRSLSLTAVVSVAVAAGSYTLAAQVPIPYKDQPVGPQSLLVRH